MKLTYRPEIDGLRAIAVAAVILFHAQQYIQLRLSLFGYNLFQGGSIGVDIFFVISGYLITSLILKELEATGKFSFLHFYERRARRILPALFVVMLTSLPFAWMYLLPTSFVDFSKSILYSTGFSSNFYFHYSGLEYASPDGLLKPFLHTWSLSIEEQFYIIFPICLILCFNFFRKYLIHLLIIGFILSLVIADWGSRNYPSFNFYTLPTRGWELLAGSILAYLEIRKGQRSSNILFNRTLPALGLFLIGLTIVLYDEKIFHPSFYTLSPIIGVCLLIWFSNKDGTITKILSSKLFVGIGLISYSLYLWHYPIFAFAEITGFATHSLLKKGFLIFLIFSLSTLTYFIIEKNFRNKIKLKLNFVAGFLLFVLIVIFSFNYFIIKQKGFPERIFSNENFTLDNEVYRYEWIDFNEKIGTPEFQDINKLNILIIGNSHSADTFNTFYLNKDLYPDYEFSIFRNLSNPIGYYSVSCFYNFLNTKDTHCGNIDYGKEKIKLFENSDMVILSTRWTSVELKLLEKIILKLRNKNKKILIFTSSLESKLIINFNALDYFIWNNERLPNKNELSEIEKQIFKQLTNTEEINNKLLKIAKKNNVKILFKEDYMCNFTKRKCDVLTTDGEKIFWDYGHYSLDGARYFGKKIHKMNWFKIL